VNIAIRKAQQPDVPAMIELAEKKRREYETYQPVFWRVAADAREKQTPYFEQLLLKENVSVELLRQWLYADIATSPNGRCWLSLVLASRQSGMCNLSSLVINSLTTWTFFQYTN
jgi:hypothetical protein